MADEYSRRVARVVAAQMAELTGFEAAQESAVEVLAEVLIRYIQELCTAAHSYAELAHRTDFNVCDLSLALNDMGANMDDLKKYLDGWLAEQGPGSFDQGFVHPLPPEYPVRGAGRQLPTWEERREAPPPHVPAWLPAFPDRHTYVRTPAFPGHEEDPAKQSEVIRATRRQGAKTALALKQQLLGAEQLPGDAEVDTNPFLRMAAQGDADQQQQAAVGTAAAGASGAGTSAPTANGDAAAAAAAASGPQAMDVDGAQGASANGGDAGSSAAAAAAAAGPSGRRPGGFGDQDDDDEDGEGEAGAGRKRRAVGAALLGKDVLHPVSVAFEAVVGPVAEDGAQGAQGAGIEAGGRRDTDAAVKWQQVQEAPGSGTSALGLPAGFTLDLASRVARQGAAFGVRRAVEDAFRPAGEDGGAGGGRYTARSRSSRYDIGDERKKAEHILAAAAAELKGHGAGDHAMDD